MLPFLWATDVHLDHCRPSVLAAFIDEIHRHEGPLVLTGDISNAHKLQGHLQLLQRDKDIYFVLGNHDAWGASIEEADSLAKSLHLDPDQPRLFYLPACEPLAVAPGEYLIGVNGYADGRAGNLLGSTVWLNDYILCKTFKGVGKKGPYALRPILNRLGDESAQQILAKLHEVPMTATRVYVATHAPPFASAHWYDGRPGDDAFLPHFVNVALGEAILTYAEAHKGCEFVVIAGHTHGGVRVQVSENVLCCVGSATYGAPQLQDLGSLPEVVVP